MKILRSCLRVLIVFCLTASAALAQTSSGSLSGTVTDPNGAVIPGVKVIATHEPTNREYETTTTDAGIYVFPTLPAGPYTLSASQPGFSKSIQTGIEVRVALRGSIDIKLAIGDVATSVEVKAEVPLLETTTPMRGQNMSPQLVATLPLFAGGIRSAESFVANMPGVNTVGEVSVNGSIGRAKEIMVDGGSLTLPESGGVVWYFPGFESFQEFKLVTSSFNAEHGRLGGGLELFVTKSGTNALHGAGFLNLRRDIFNAAGWGVNHVVGRTPGYRPKERYNNEGFTVGGPVYIPKVYDGRNRTFFFVTYDKDSRPVSLNAAYGETIPTMMMRTGNFSEVSTIYDPLSTSGTTRTPFANNTIPTARFSGISTKMLPSIPATNRSGVTANYDFMGTTKLNDYVATVKLDHSFSPSNRLAFWMARRNQVNTGTQYMPGVLSNMVDVINDPWWYRANHDLILSPTTLLHTTFSFTKDRNAWNPTNQQGGGSSVGLLQHRRGRLHALRHLGHRQPAMVG